MGEAASLLFTLSLFKCKMRSFFKRSMHLSTTVNRSTQKLVLKLSTVLSTEYYTSSTSSTTLVQPYGMSHRHFPYPLIHTPHIFKDDYKPNSVRTVVLRKLIVWCLIWSSPPTGRVSLPTALLYSIPV